MPIYIFSIALFVDARTLVDHARIEAQNHRFTFDEVSLPVQFATSLSHFSSFFFFSLLISHTAAHRRGGADAVCVRPGAGLRRGAQGGRGAEDEPALRRVAADGGLRPQGRAPAVLLGPLRCGAMLMLELFIGM